MRTFIVVSTLFIVSAIYDIGGKELPWRMAIGFILLMSLAGYYDHNKRKD